MAEQASAVGEPICPVILCGGSGIRLWPVSSETAPKQLQSFVGVESLLQATAARVSGGLFQPPIVVTAEAFAATVAHQLAATGAAPAIIALEPAGRNTAPAIGLAAFFEVLAGRDPLLLAMPSDHVILDERAFTGAIRSGIAAANDGKIVTFGVRPRRPETGYGYIEADTPDSAAGAVAVVRFTEKPDLDAATKYVASGRHFWNAGIFLFRASVMVKELRLRARQVANACEMAVAAAEIEGEFLRPASDPFLSSPSISIDYAVIEKSDRVAMVEADIGWSDIGSWDALWEIAAKDGAGNATSGQVLLLGSTGCLVRNELDAPVAVVDATDLVVVVGGAGTLIVPRRSAQNTKLAAEALKKARP